MSSPQKKKNARLACLIVIIALAFVALAIWRVWDKADHHRRSIKNTKITGTLLKTPMPMPKLDLMQAGKPHFTNQSLQGHWTLMFFGFSSCPYVCPTTLAQLNEMMGELKKNGYADQLPQIVMVSVDPARDTAARMASYVHGFNPQFIGLRTTSEKTRQLAAGMKVSFAKVQAGNNSKRYTVTHTASIMVIGPQGLLRAYLSYPHVFMAMAHDYKVILQAYHV